MHLYAPGLIGLRVDGSRGALVEVNSETDFVARNAKFQEFVEKALEVALDKAEAGGGAAAASATQELNVQELLQAEHPGSQNDCWLLPRTSMTTDPGIYLGYRDLRVHKLFKY